VFFFFFPSIDGASPLLPVFFFFPGRQRIRAAGISFSPTPPLRQPVMCHPPSTILERRKGLSSFLPSIRTTFVPSPPPPFSPLSRGYERPVLPFFPLRQSRARPRVRFSSAYMITPDVGLPPHLISGSPQGVAFFFFTSHQLAIAVFFPLPPQLPSFLSRCQGRVTHFFFVPREHVFLSTGLATFPLVMFLSEALSSGTSPASRYAFSFRDIRFPPLSPPPATTRARRRKGSRRGMTPSFGGKRSSHKEVSDSQGNFRGPPLLLLGKLGGRSFFFVQRKGGPVAHSFPPFFSYPWFGASFFSFFSPQLGTPPRPFFFLLFSTPWNEGVPLFFFPPRGGKRSTDFFPPFPCIIDVRSPLGLSCPAGGQ